MTHGVFIQVKCFTFPAEISQNSLAIHNTWRHLTTTIPECFAITFNIEWHSGSCHHWDALIFLSSSSGKN